MHSVSKSLVKLNTEKSLFHSKSNSLNDHKMFFSLRFWSHNYSILVGEHFSTRQSMHLVCFWAGNSRKCSFISQQRGSSASWWMQELEIILKVSNLPGRVSGVVEVKVHRFALTDGRVVDKSLTPWRSACWRLQTLMSPRGSDQQSSLGPNTKPHLENVKFIRKHNRIPDCFTQLTSLNMFIKE